MKGAMVILAVCAVAAFTAAGCISDPANTEDLLVGTWIAHDHTTSSGMHYAEVSDTYFANNSGTERITLDNGTIIEWDLFWLKNADTYVAYYQPITMTINSDNTTAIVNSGKGVADWVVEHVSGTGAAGEWKLVTSESGTFASPKSAKLQMYENGSSLLTMDKGDAGTFVTIMEWVEIGTGMIVHSPSKPVQLRISDGMLYDNFNLTYTRV